MIAQRQIARAAQRFSAQARAQTQRRFASHETENHFVRERRHVKEHAGPTTGAYTAESCYNWVGS
jgi:cytochrome c oxidase subunit 6a